MLTQVVGILRHRGWAPVSRAMELQGMRAGQEQRMVQRQITRPMGQGLAGGTGPPGCRGTPGSGG